MGRIIVFGHKLVGDHLGQDVGVNVLALLADDHLLAYG